MIKIKLIVPEYQEQEYEASFPLYRIHKVDYKYTVYTRIAIDGEGFVCHEVTEHDGEYSIEIRHYRELDGRSGADYCLGRGEYKSSAEEFEEALEKVQSLIDQMS
ncbi:MAG: hypothetical protein AAGA91_04535 [Pseudomonadota bacterium]